MRHCRVPNNCKHPGCDCIEDLSSEVVITDKTFKPLGMRVCEPSCHSAAACLHPDNCRANMKWENERAAKEQPGEQGKFRNTDEPQDLEDQFSIDNIKFKLPPPPERP